VLRAQLSHFTLLFQKIKQAGG